jgi:hypothetical protein
MHAYGRSTGVLGLVPGDPSRQSHPRPRPHRGRDASTLSGRDPPDQVPTPRQDPGHLDVTAGTALRGRGTFAVEPVGNPRGWTDLGQ